MAAEDVIDCPEANEVAAEAEEAVHGEETPRQQLGIDFVSEATRRTKFSERPDEGGSEKDDDLSHVAVDVDVDEPNLVPHDEHALLSEAKLHMRRTACTVLNKETGEYEFEPLWETTPRMMGHLGVGVQLYFQFIKQMGIIFLIMAILSSPALGFNIMGSMVDDSSSVNNAFGRLSIANLGNCPASGCQSSAETRERCAFVFHLPVFMEREQDACDLRVVDITQWLGLLDGLSILLFMGFGVFFVHWWIPHTVRETDEAQITPADYTIWIHQLPKFLDQDHELYMEKLKDHFQNILKTLKDPVDDDQAVYDVCLVREYNGAIMRFTSKGRHLQDQDNARVLEAEAKASGKDKVAAKFSKTIAKRDNKINRIERSLGKEAKITDERRGVCSAFVIFRHEQYKDKILNEYRFGQHALFRLCQPERLRFEGHNLKVEEACEPTDLYWENLDYNRWKRLMRKGVVLILTFLVLVLCSVVIASVESVSSEPHEAVQKTTWVIANAPSSGTDCLSFCSWDLFSSSSCVADGATSATWGTERLFDATGAVAASATQLDATCSSPWQSIGCSSPGSNASWIGIEFSFEHAVKCMKVLQDGNSPASELRLFACSSAPSSAASLASWNPAEHCQAMEVVYPASGTLSGSLKVVADTSCATDPSDYVTFEVAEQAKIEAGSSPLSSTTFNCFCKQQAKNNFAGFITPPYDTPAEELCQEWSQETAQSYGKVVGAALAVVILNEVLLVIYSSFIAWERLCTVTELAQSQLWKLFISQFLNTGLLMVLVNASIKQYPDVLFFIKFLSIGEGSYHDLSSQWFTVVGTTLVLTIFLEIFNTTVPPLMMSYVVTPLKARFYRKTKVTQEALNDIYTLPEWNLPLRLAQSMNVIFCVVMYSGGMPILYIIGFVYCVAAYWLDKWCLLRGSCRPPAYKEDIMKMSVHMLPVAAFLHTLVAAWAFGNQVLFPSEWSVLKPLAESVFGITEERYDEVMEAYRMGQMDGVTWDFCSARFLDFARKGAWLLMLIFLGSCVYYVVYWLWVMLLKPFLSPFAFLAKEGLKRLTKKCLKRCGWHRLLHLLRHTEDTPSMPYEEAKLEMEAKGITSSYRLADNVKYQAAYKALLHTAELVKQMTEKSIKSLATAAAATDDADSEAKVVDEEDAKKAEQ